MVEFFETDNKFYLVFELIRGGKYYFMCQLHPSVTRSVMFVNFFTASGQFKKLTLFRSGSLEARIEEIGKQIQEAQVKSLVHSIATALDFLHGRGIAHRDIKPANILLPDPHSVNFQNKASSL